MRHRHDKRLVTCQCVYFILNKVKYSRCAQVDRSRLWNRNGTETEVTGNLDKPTGSVSENGWKPSKICGSLSPDSGRATRGTFLRLPAAHFTWNRLDFLDFQHADFGRIITKNFPVNSDDSRALEPA